MQTKIDQTKQVNKKDIAIFVALFLMTLGVFCYFLMGHYATDTYNMIDIGYHEYAIQYSLNDGRPLMCLICLLADHLYLPIQVYVVGLTVLALFLSNITVMVLKSVMEKVRRPEKAWQEGIILIIAYGTIFHFAFLENMQYVECAVMALNILLYTIAAKKMVFRQQYVIASILALLAILCYQGTITWFVTVTLLFSLIEQKRVNRHVIKNVIIAIVISIVSIGIDVLQIKICGTMPYGVGNRATNMMALKSIGELPKNMITVCKSLPDIYLNTFKLFPKYIWITSVLVMLLLGCLSVRSRQDVKQRVGFIIVVIVCILISSVPDIVTDKSAETARMSFSMGATIGCMMIYLYCNTDVFQIPTLWQKILVIVLLLYAGITIGNYITIMREHHEVNLLNQQEAEQIGKYLEEYERNSKVALKQIVIIYDTKPTLYFPEKNRSSLCERAACMKWSNVAMINYYTGRKLKKEENVENEYTQKLSSQNWNSLEKDQFLFSGNTVYYAIY